MNENSKKSIDVNSDHHLDDVFRGSSDDDDSLEDSFPTDEVIEKEAKKLAKRLSKTSHLEGMSYAKFSTKLAKKLDLTDAESKRQLKKQKKSIIQPVLTNAQNNTNAPQTKSPPDLEKGMEQSISEKQDKESTWRKICKSYKVMQDDKNIEQELKEQSPKQAAPTAKTNEAKKECGVQWLAMALIGILVFIIVLTAILVVLLKDNGSNSLAEATPAPTEKYPVRWDSMQAWPWSIKLAGRDENISSLEECLDFCSKKNAPYGCFWHSSRSFTGCSCWAEGTRPCPATRNWYYGGTVFSKTDPGC